MNEAMNRLFTFLSSAGELVVERPGKGFYVLLIILSLISHLTALVILISVLCYSYMRGLHAVR